MARAELSNGLRSGAAARPGAAALRSVALPVPAELVLLALISAAALTLRLWQLGEWSFWVDEILSLEVAERLGMSSGRLSMGLIDLLVTRLGTSEWSARLGPALVGAFTIPLLYLPTRRMLGAPVALLSSLLLAISPWHIFWSQNARFYTVLLLYYTLGLFTFYAGLERDQPWYFAIFLTLAILAYKERLFGLFMAPVAFAYVAVLKVLPWAKPPGLRWFTPASAAIALVAVGVVAYLMMRPFDVFFATFWGQPLDAQRPLASALTLMIDVPYRISFPLFAVAAFGAFQLVSARQRSGLFLSLSAGIPVLALLALAPVSWVESRYAFMALAFWTMLGAAGLLELLSYAARRPPRVAWALALGFFLLAALDPGLEDAVYYYLAPHSSAGQVLALALLLAVAAAGLLAAGHLLRTRTPGAPGPDSPLASTNPGALLLSLIIPLVVLLRVMLAGSLYYWEQDGWRYDWKTAMAYIDEHRLADDVIATVGLRGRRTSLPEASYYAGAEALDHTSPEVKSALQKGQRAWIINLGPRPALEPLAPWAEPICQPVQLQDRFRDGELMMFRVFLCDPSAHPEGSTWRAGQL